MRTQEALAEKPLRVRGESMRNALISDIKKRIILFEGCYLDAEHVASMPDRALTRERYHFFERWLEDILRTGVMPPSWRAGDFAREIALMIESYEALSLLQTTGGLPAAFVKNHWERLFVGNEFILENIPAWPTFPTGDHLKEVYGFEFENIDVNRLTGRLLQDPNDRFREAQNCQGLGVVTADLLNLRYAEKNAIKRKEFLHQLDTSEPFAEYPRALLISTQQVMEKIAEHSTSLAFLMPTSIPTNVLLEGFDLLDVRPAMIGELMACISEIGMPPNGLPINALGSLFTDTGGRRRFFYARGQGEGQKTTLGAESIKDELWSELEYFLVFKKVH